MVTKIDIAYEYAKGRPKNAISARQWEILKGPNRHLLGGFLQRWKLERWSQLLASGVLSKDDFAWLVQGKKDLAGTVVDNPSGHIDPCRCG